MFFAIAFFVFCIFPKNAQAHIGYAYMTLDTDKDIMTSEQTVVNAILHNEDQEAIESVGIIVLKDGLEIAKNIHPVFNFFSFPFIFLPLEHKNKIYFLDLNNSHHQK